MLEVMLFSCFYYVVSYYSCGGIFVLFFGGGQVDVDLGVGDYVFVFIVQFVVIGSGYVEGFNEYMLDFWVD